MWARFGTPTGRFASGTVAEYVDAMERQKATGRPKAVLFFFNELPPPSNKPEDVKQWLKVREFREQLCGLKCDYNGIQGFAELVDDQLRMWCHRIAVKLITPRVAPSRLPQATNYLVGRDAELQHLDEAWASAGRTRITSIVAWGGVGKTALVRHWRDRMSLDAYRGAEAVFDWSFYSQGASDKAASADDFVVQALQFFDGIGRPQTQDAGRTENSRRSEQPHWAALSPWERGALLADIIGRKRTLLIMDGLEPLQYPPGPMAGQLKDPALEALFEGLAGWNSGLCVITTREPLSGLAERSVVERINLAHLTNEAGAQLLARRGVVGTNEELEEAASCFGGHALALNLLGSYLYEAFDDHDVRHWRNVALMEEDAEQGGHARGVMRSYERWLGEDSREWAVLHLMGLFDRPADSRCLASLRREPEIPGLTEPIVRLTDRQWSRTITRLERLFLLSRSARGAQQNTRE